MRENARLPSQAELSALVRDTVRHSKIFIYIWMGLSIAVVVIGCVLIVASAMGAVKDAAVIGALGAASIIGTLITNPTDKIGRASARLVAVQAAYLALLTHIEILGGIGFEKELKRSQQLHECVMDLLRLLEGAGS